MANISEIRIKAEPRSVTGKQVAQLRRSGVTPGSLKGPREPLAIQAETKPLQTVLTRAGTTQLIQLEVNGKARPVLVRQVQRDPVSRGLLHVEFFEVNLREKTRATVPVELRNESPAAKEGGALVRGIATIEVEALPTDLPAVIDVDLSQITQVGQAIFVRDIVPPSGVEIVTKEDELLATVTVTRATRVEAAAEEAESAEAAVAAEPGAAGQEEPAGG